jgi:hypothetical protein
LLVEASICVTRDRTCTQLGEYGLADAQLAESLALRRIGLDQEHPQVLVSMSELAKRLRRQNRFNEAEPLLLDSDARLAPQEEERGEEARKTSELLVALYEAWEKPARGTE